MAKRFTETKKWLDPWFCELKPIEKLFFFYLIENCDHAGIWQVNWPLVRFHLGTTSFDLSKFEGRILQLSESKWFMKKFIDFQYNGHLNPENRTHASVISILEKEGAYKGLTSPLQGCKDKDTVKDKGLDKGLKGRVYKGKGFKKPSLEEVRAYCQEIKTDIDPDFFYNTYESQGWIKANGQPILNWKLTIKTWENRNNKPVEMLTDIQKRNIANFNEFEKNQKLKEV